MELSPAKLEILEALLPHNRPVKAATVTKELGKQGKEAKAVQTHLFGLVRAGLAEAPNKGQYVISLKGMETLGLSEVTKEMACEILAQKPERAFHFYAGLGKPLHIYACDLADFCNKLNVVDVNSVSFHMSRGDFEAWIKMLGDVELAKKIALLNNRKISDEELRELLHTLVEKRCIMLTKVVGQSVPSN